MRLSCVVGRRTVPAQFLVQRDDQTREQSLALFDALASGHKTLHVTPASTGLRLRSK